MFSRKTVIIAGIIVFIAVNVIILSITSRREYASSRPGPIAIALVAPFQKMVTRSVQFVRDIWLDYFFLVSVAKENTELRLALKQSMQSNNQCYEVRQKNSQLRNMLNYQEKQSLNIAAAEVVGRDPSPWLKTIIIDKGKSDGVIRGLPVVVPEGIVGQVVDVSNRYAKVLMIIDQNSAVDALVQRTRARGVIKGESENRCLFKFALRKHDIKIGDTIISSGMDGVYPKGLTIGKVSQVIKRSAGIFQDVAVVPFVDFEKLEEVLVILDLQTHDLDHKS